MQFTTVIFSTYELLLESLAIAKLAHPFFMPKYVVFSILGTILDTSIKVKDNTLSKCKNIFLLNELFFTSPQLKITLFNTVILQLALMCCIFYSNTVNNVSLFIKEKS